MNVLLTGFESYGGRSVNPAEEVVRALDGEAIAGATVRGRTLPVDFARLGPRIEEIAAATRPGVFVGLGLWPGEPMIRLERVAVNLADFEIADNTGSLIRGPVVDGDVDAYRSTLPIHAIQDRLLEAGIPARLSGSAGSFLCNAMMYHALKASAARSPAPLCGFVHLPYLPEQVSALVRETRAKARLELHQRADLCSMSLDTMLRAVRLVVEISVEAARRD